MQGECVQRAGGTAACGHARAEHAARRAHGRRSQLAWRAVLLAAAVGAVARGPLARGALVHLGIGVAGSGRGEGRPGQGAFQRPAFGSQSDSASSRPRITQKHFCNTPGPLGAGCRLPGRRVAPLRPPPPHPSLIVMLRSSSFLKRTVCTPVMALTTVDFPCATWPMVPGVGRRGVVGARCARAQGRPAADRPRCRQARRRT